MIQQISKINGVLEMWTHHMELSSKFRYYTSHWPAAPPCPCADGLPRPATSYEFIYDSMVHLGSEEPRATSYEFIYVSMVHLGSEEPRA